MRGTTLAALAATVGFGFVAESATAGFQWLQPWQVTTAGDAAFGDLNADSASGSANVLVNTLLNPPVNRPSASIDFSRAFSLSGSPAGWELDFFVQTDGDLGSLHGLASIGLDLSVDGRQAYQSSQDAQGISTPISLKPFDGLISNDGVHLLTGSLKLNASLAPPSIGPGLASVDLRSFTVTLTPTPLPVPEPTSFLLTALGLGLMKSVGAKFGRVAGVSSSRPRRRRVVGWHAHVFVGMFMRRIRRLQ